MLTYGSSRGMTKEQINRWSKDVEPKVVAEGGLSETTREESEGIFPEGLMDDDR